MKIDEVVAYYPVSMQESVRKEIAECDIGSVIFKAIGGTLEVLNSEPIARLLVPSILSFGVKSQVAVVNTALVAHEVLDANPVENLSAEVLSKIASLGEPLAQRILEQVLGTDYKGAFRPQVLLDLTKHHSCALELYGNSKGFNDEIVLAGCMRWNDIAQKEMLTDTFTLLKVAAAHFHHEFSDEVAKLMVKSYLNHNFKEIEDQSYKYSNFFNQVLPHVKDKSILHELIEKSACTKPNALKYLRLIAKNDPLGVTKHMQTTELTNTVQELLKCHIAPQDGGIQALCEAKLLLSNRSADVALVLNHADPKTCQQYFEQNTVDTHTVSLLKEKFLKFKDKMSGCDFALKNPGLRSLFIHSA